MCELVCDPAGLPYHPPNFREHHLLRYLNLAFMATGFGAPAHGMGNKSRHKSRQLRPKYAQNHTLGDGKSNVLPD